MRYALVALALGALSLVPSWGTAQTDQEEAAWLALLTATTKVEISPPMSRRVHHSERVTIEASRRWVPLPLDGSPWSCQTRRVNSRSEWAVYNEVQCQNGSARFDTVAACSPRTRKDTTRFYLYENDSSNLRDVYLVRVSCEVRTD